MLEFQSAFEREREILENTIDEKAKQVVENEIVKRAINQVYVNATQKFLEPIPPEILVEFEACTKLIIKKVIESSDFAPDLTDAHRMKTVLAAHIDKLMIENLYEGTSFLATSISKIKETLHIPTEQTDLFNYDFAKFVNSVGQVTVLMQYLLNPSILKMTDQEYDEVEQKLRQTAEEKGIELIGDTPKAGKKIHGPSNRKQKRRTYH